MPSPLSSFSQFLRSRPRLAGMALTLVLCLPLLWINAGASHDWGGDFSMYIRQAANIVEGIPQAENGYIYNEAYPMLGPKAYPVGYPLLLAPVYAIFGNDMTAFLGFQSLILLGFAALLFLFFRRWVSLTAAILLSLIVVYNPWTVSFKRELMSDLPFAMLMVGAYLAYTRSKSFLPGGLLAGLALATRSIGWAWVPAILMDLLTQYMRHRRGGGDPPDYRKALGGLLLPIAVSFLLNRILFHIPSGFSLYSGNLDFSTLSDTFFQNLAFYAEAVQWFFQAPSDTLKFLTILTKLLMVGLILIGWVNRFFKRPELMDWLVMAYVGILLIYPYRSAGVRFLFPVIPYLLVYAVEGFRSIQFSFSFPRRYQVWVLGGLILVQYGYGLGKIIGRQDKAVSGPQQAESVEAFQKVREMVPEDAAVAFTKARVLSLYTGRASGVNRRDQPVEEVRAWYKQNRFDYFLTHKQLRDKALFAFLEAEKDQMEHLWGNKWFDLYRRKAATTPAP